jgi:polyphosphate kinase 2
MYLEVTTMAKQSTETQDAALEAPAGKVDSRQLKKDRKKEKKDRKAALKLASKTGGEAAGDGPKKVSRKVFETEIRRLQTELCALQEWVKETGARVVIVFEGRDAAGKGGIIRSITERVSPRVFRVVALPAPSDREKSQLYIQRYIQHFPAAGEVVIFDRSWYNRAGVEHVMGFCTQKQYEGFLDVCPFFEHQFIKGGIVLLKYWLEVGNEEQAKRFEARVKDPMRQWKLSAMDLPSRAKWYEYSKARDAMLAATDTGMSPWHIVRSDDKKRTRLNLITHLLSQFPYTPLKKNKVKLPPRDKKHAYDDQTPMLGKRWIPEKF